MPDNSAIAMSFAEQIQAAFSAASHHSARGEYDQAEEYFTKTLTLLEKAGDRLGQARVWCHLAQLAEIQNDTDNIIRAYREALNAATAVGELAIQAQAAHNLGHLLRMSFPAEAKKLFLQSAAASFEMQDARGAALSHAMVGQIVFTDENQSEGLRIMLQGLSMMPDDADEVAHLVEHVAFFGLRVTDELFRKLVTATIVDPKLRNCVLAENDNRRSESPQDL